jgi:hypothetical protein
MKGRIFAPLVLALFLCTGPALAQSTAKAPRLDASLKRFIGAMTPLTARQLGPLEDRVVVVTFCASWCPSLGI